jgi:hypothetical protein
MFSPKNKECFKLFYTDEEIEGMPTVFWLRYRAERFWYNLSEWFLLMRESDERWMKNND